MTEPDFTNPSTYAIKTEVCNDEQQNAPDFSSDSIITYNNFQPNVWLSQPTKREPGLPCTENVKYKKEDLYPTVKDPRCDPNWPLASFWPVYVGNFHCQIEDNRGKKIRNYFASKGLLVRWWFFRDDFYYRQFQTEAGLYDMLVYFVSEADAQLAVQLCNREVLDGYKLNVFPGRDPVYFAPERTVYYTDIRSGHVFSEEFFERHLNKFGPNTCVVKFALKVGAVEFQNSSSVNDALKKDKLWKPERVGNNLQKQRFVEKDLINDIELHLAGNPNALQLDANEPIVQMLLQGKKIEFARNAHIDAQPIRRGPPKSRQANELRKKHKKWEKYITKCLKNDMAPKCHARNKNAKKHFRSMVEKLQQQKYC